jgi:precorrin-6A/cobalt-precorrin-6A reductase
MPRILVLGGTTEARLLGERLANRAEFDVTLSLAGRTASPVAHAVPIRIGGFGGPSGLADYLRHERIDALIDATHPFASTISANAAVAAHQTDVRFIALRRPQWIAVAGDRWIEVDGVDAAVTAIGEVPRCVFVALGRNELAAFMRAPQHSYLVRSVDPVDPPLPLPDVAYITERGPFSEAHDAALMKQHRIETVIAKNSGGSAAYGKIAAARMRGIAVIMLRRPASDDSPAVETIDDAVAWLDHALTCAAARGV